MAEFCTCLMRTKSYITQNELWTSSDACGRVRQWSHCFSSISPIGLCFWVFKMFFYDSYLILDHNQVHLSWIFIEHLTISVSNFALVCFSSFHSAHTYCLLILLNDTVPVNFSCLLCLKDRTSTFSGMLCLFFSLFSRRTLFLFDLTWTIHYTNSLANFCWLKEHLDENLTKNFDKKCAIKKYDKSSKLRQLSAFLLVQYFFQLSLFVRFGVFSALISVLFVHQCLSLSVSPLLLSNAFNLEWCTLSHWHQCIMDYRPSYKHYSFCFVFVDPF